MEIVNGSLVLNEEEFTNLSEEQFHKDRRTYLGIMVTEKKIIILSDMLDHYEVRHVDNISDSYNIKTNRSFPDWDSAYDYFISSYFSLKMIYQAADKEVICKAYC